MKCGWALAHARALCFVSKNRSTTIALRSAGVRPSDRAALRNFPASPNLGRDLGERVRWEQLFATIEFLQEMLANSLVVLELHHHDIWPTDERVRKRQHGNPRALLGRSRQQLWS